MVKGQYKQIDAGNIAAHLRPGRHLCHCQARVHNLIRNCLGCGRVVCEQEGSGPCFYCGRLVCTREERKLIEKKDKDGLVLLRKLLNDPKIERIDLGALDSSAASDAMSLSSLGKSIEAAAAYKQKLLKADKDQEVTRVNDLQADYFNLEHNPYLTSAEREAIVKRKEELRQLSLQAKRSVLVDVDVASGSMQEQKKKPIETVDDPIIKTILDNSAARNMHQKITIEGTSDEEPTLIDTFRPKYEEGLSRAEVRSKEWEENGKIRSSRQKLYCIALKQPIVSNLLDSLSDSTDICFIPWRQYVEVRGPVILAALGDDDPVEYYNGTQTVEENAEKQKPRRSILATACLYDCITWDEFNHEHSSLPAFRPLDNSFVLLLTNVETLSWPIPNVCSSEFFQVEGSLIDAVNGALVSGNELFGLIDATLMLKK